MSYLGVGTDSGSFSVNELKTKGFELQEAYTSAEPFPHTVIDDFLPEAWLETMLAEFPTAPDPDSMAFDRDQERLKASFNPDYLAPKSRSLFYAFNSRPFVRFLENVTGIKGLIPDPYFTGGGFHEIRQGGHLSVHADFNHHKVMNVERRINVLIYLNKGWRPDYGGQLELWDENMARCRVSVVPELNRCVIFSTTSKSYHGNPQPVNHPEGTPRRSIALYYYTATWDAAKAAHSTLFRVRPNSADRVDWQRIASDFVPPVVLRNVRRLGRLTRH